MMPSRAEGRVITVLHREANRHAPAPDRTRTLLRILGYTASGAADSKRSRVRMAGDQFSSRAGHGAWST